MRIAVNIAGVSGVSESLNVPVCWPGVMLSETDNSRSTVLPSILVISNKSFLMLANMFWLLVLNSRLRLLASCDRMTSSESTTPSVDPTVYTTLAVTGGEEFSVTDSVQRSPSTAAESSVQLI